MSNPLNTTHQPHNIYEVLTTANLAQTRKLNQPYGAVPGCHFRGCDARWLTALFRRDHPSGADRRWKNHFALIVEVALELNLADA